uniref:probable protein phosphatase 2C 43 n=1 Tax=Erigeron canadensis TaxID=72917 RepID=UPI001CB99957|nr:probable protein phosphatase 2C 43 [Erigeron canadensis]
MELVRLAKNTLKKSSVAHKWRMRKDYRDVGDRPGDEGIWSKDLEPHAFGEYSFAAIRANEPMEDHSQVDVGVRATFVGVYDGHHGDATAVHIRESLLGHLVREYLFYDLYVIDLLGQLDLSLTVLYVVAKWSKVAKWVVGLNNGSKRVMVKYRSIGWVGSGHIQQQRSVSQLMLEDAFDDTEKAWVDFVEAEHVRTPDVTKIGSCCLVGLLWDGMLYVGNVGDSRAVIGQAVGKGNKVVARQVTQDHNVNLDEAREEVKHSNRHDPGIVVKVNGIWRVKGVIQVSRSIGDLYLKMPKFVDLGITGPLREPALSNAPFLKTKDLQSDDKFVVFASDGLWENISNQEAVEIVNKHPRAGIAKTLVRLAMKEAAIKKGLKYDDLPRYQPGARRDIHDDITVVVIFFDNETRANLNEVSVKGLENMATPSELRWLQGQIITG